MNEHEVIFYNRQTGKITRDYFKAYRGAVQHLQKLGYRQDPYNADVWYNKDYFASIKPYTGIESFTGGPRSW